MLGISKESAMTVAKFRGCLVGSLLGDCLGAPYEGDVTVSRSVLQKYFDKLEEPKFKAPIKQYTDDTAMTRALTESLIQCKSFNEVDVAKRYVQSYCDQPRRGYGMNVVETFAKLKNTEFKDIWEPAACQFNGSGSYGNGGAMRISPLALFHHSNLKDMFDSATKCTKITHTNPLGINGALLQCLAVNMCLHHDPGKPIDTNNFTSNLMEKMDDIESKSNENSKNYQQQLKLMEELLCQDPENDFEEEIVNLLGHTVNALYSVPTAIYCFLRGQKPIGHIKTDNPFRRVLQLSISLGGDTDTIASMAGAMSGAYHGIDTISPVLQSHCEGFSDTVELANKLFEVSTTGAS